MHTLDTNEIIYYLKGDPQATSKIEQIFALGTPVFISTITEIELFGFGNLSLKEATLIEKFLSLVTSIPVDSALARIAGQLRRLYNLKTADSAIAATALYTGSILLTRNTKDFKRIANLKVQEV